MKARRHRERWGQGRRGIDIREGPFGQSGKEREGRECQFGIVAEAEGKKDNWAM